MSRVIRKIRHICYFLLNKKRFNQLAYSTDLHEGVRIDGAENIKLGNHVIVQRFSWLGAVPLAESESCILEVGDGTVIGNFNHIYSTRRVSIGHNVLFADRVYVSDCAHSFEDVGLPIIQQPIKQLDDVEIGDGAWLGENVCVIGCKVGRNSVIGANSVVTSDIPENCVAVGAPARVIKRYNKETSKWERV